MRLLAKTCLTLALCLGAGSYANASTCVGNCGTLGPDGDVTAPPAAGPNYSFVSTANGETGGGQIASVGGTNGSEFITSSFAGAVGDSLNFYFNYVTSDGAGYADYGFAELLTSTLDHVAYLFTARTTPSDDTSPGFGLPANSSTLNPATTPIIAGAPMWSALGSSSGTCYNAGCGLTGWINSNYQLTEAGNYVLKLGVTNWSDTAYQSGLAFAGVTIAGEDIPIPSDPQNGAVPEPATWAMLVLGMFGMGGALRRRRRQAALLTSHA